MGQTFSRDRKNRGPVSQQLFHKKDPSLLKGHTHKGEQRPAFCGFISNVTSTLTILAKCKKNVAPKSEKNICHIKATYSAFKRDNFVFKSTSLKRTRKNNTTLNFIFHTYFCEKSLKSLNCSSCVTSTRPLGYRINLCINLVILK